MKALWPVSSRFSAVNLYPSGRRMLAGLVLGNLLAISLIAALAILSLASGRDTFSSRAQVATENLAHSLSLSLSAKLDLIDHALQAIALAYARDEAEGLLETQRVERLLNEQDALVPDIEQPRILDEHGTLRFGKLNPALELSNAELQNGLQQARSDGTSILLISEPLYRRDTRSWVLMLSKRLNHPDGHFAGLVQAEVAIEQLQQVLSSMDVGPRGALTLRTVSRRLVARHTGLGESGVPIGSDQISAQLQEALQAHPEAGHFLATTAIDGVERSSAYQRVGPYPLLILVGLGTDDFLAPWYSQVRQVVALSLLLALSLVAASVGIYRAWSRELLNKAAVQREARRHQALLRTSSDGVHVLNAEGRLVELNEAFSHMLGYQRDEMLGMHLSQWDAEWGQPDQDQSLKALMQQNSFALKTRQLRRDRHVIEVEITGAPVHIDGHLLLFCASRDITERNATARELQQHREQLEQLVALRTAEVQNSEARFRAFMAATPAMAWITDAAGRLCYANTAWERALGLGPAEWQDQTALQILPPSVALALQAQDAQVLQSSQALEQLSATGLPGGPERHWQIIKFPLPDSRGAPQVASIAIDISAQVQAEAERTDALLREQALRDAAERHADNLREAVNERDEFVRVLAHEVRQPLNNASAALESAAAVLTQVGQIERGPATHRIRRAQGVISQIVGSLDNTLAATALLSSAQRVVAHDADVDVLIELSLAELLVEQRGRVQVERISSTRTASMDSGLMRLALRNVLSNALAYSPASTPVVLRITDSDEPLALVFEILDAGPGVSDELLPQLFERGVRGPSDLPGHGIGLYVVRRVMELHGGTVDVRRNQPTGTVFRLWLPQDL
jgi:PAS domain S-box-containing protein